MALTYDPTAAIQNGFYSSPYSIPTNRMIPQTSITPFIAASPVSTYQIVPILSVVQNNVKTALVSLGASSKSGGIVQVQQKPGCCDNTNNGPHYVNAASKHDGPSDPTDEPPFLGHNRNDIVCEISTAANWFKMSILVAVLLHVSFQASAAKHSQDFMFQGSLTISNALGRLPDLLMSRLTDLLTKDEISLGAKSENTRNVALSRQLGGIVLEEKQGTGSKTEEGLPVSSSFKMVKTKNPIGRDYMTAAAPMQGTYIPQYTPVPPTAVPIEGVVADTSPQTVASSSQEASGQQQQMTVETSSEHAPAYSYQQSKKVDDKGTVATERIGKMLGLL
ncbi:hypothetical protein BTVI_96337 [Pitangus sulphuratus]|nr:hypothetical protein BTVI_96337 [Pitangus sulphuratus]